MPISWLNELSPELWSVSIFDCDRLVAAVGRDAVAAAFCPDNNSYNGDRWDPSEYTHVGMTDYGTVNVSRTGTVSMPEKARAPAGGLDLGSFLRHGKVWSGLERDELDGLIAGRLPGGAWALASITFDTGSIAHVDVRFPFRPDSRAQGMLAAIGVRDLECRADGGVYRVRYEVDLRVHFDRTRRAGPQAAAPGACNGHFLYSGKAGKSVGLMRDALELACREYRDRLRGCDPYINCADPGIVHAAEQANSLMASSADDRQVDKALANLVGLLDGRCAEDHSAVISHGAADPGGEIEQVVDALQSYGRYPPRRAPSTRRAARIEPSTMSLPQMLSNALEYVSPRLLPSMAIGGLRSLAAQIGEGRCPNPLALEVHFGGAKAAQHAVDLLACWCWDDGGLAQPLALVDPPEPLDRLGSLWDDGPEGVLIERMDQLWLEFDADRGGRPMPAVFFTARSRRARRADIALELSRAVVSRLYPSGAQDPFTAACDASADLLGRVPVPNVGLMFPRPASPLRLVVAPGVWDDASEPEHWVGDDPGGQRLGQVWRRICGSFGRALPAIDLGSEGLLASRGMELRIDRGPLRRSASAWRGPLQALQREGLVTASEAREFAACFKQYRLPSGEWMSIIPAYVKIAIDSTGTLSAKGYISIQRSRVPPYEIGA